MTIKEITVNENNVIEVIQDPSVHVIKTWMSGEYIMRPIKDANIEDIFSKDVCFIKIIR